MVIPALLAAIAAPALATLAVPTAVTIPDIVEVSDVSGVSVSPDGTQVAFRTDHARLDCNCYELDWYIGPVDGSTPPRKVADGGGAVFSDAGPVRSEMPIWAPTSNAIYIRALIDGEIQIWRAAADGGGAQAVTQEAGNVRDMAGTAEGDLLYHVGPPRETIERAEDAARDNGVLVDPSVDITQPLSRGMVVDGRLASQRSVGPAWFDRGGILAAIPVTERRIPLSKSAPSILHPPSAGAIVTTGKVTTMDGDIATAQLADGRVMQCDMAACRGGRLVSIVPLRAPDQVLITLTDALAEQSLLIWTPSAHTVRPLVSVPGLLNGGRDPSMPCAPAPDALICVEASATAPPRLVRVDIERGADRRSPVTLYDPNRALRARSTLVARPLLWDIDGKFTIGAQLILPPGPRPARGFPIVVTYYVCPGFLRGGLGDELPLLPLASAGVATLCINHAPGSDPLHPAPLEDYGRALEAVRVIVDRLTRDGTVDKARIGMWGLSFGSEVTMQVAMHSDLLAAVSVASGLIEPSLYWMHGMAGNSLPESLRTYFRTGAPDDDREGWKRISPVLNMATLHAPILLQIPEQEARASMQTLTTLTRAGRPIEMWAFANAPHIKNQPRQKRAAYVRNQDWFRFWLQDAEDQTPDKADQYRRWHLLATEQRRGAGGEALARP